MYEIHEILHELQTPLFPLLSSLPLTSLVVRLLSYSLALSVLALGRQSASTADTKKSRSCRRIADETKGSDALPKFAPNGDELHFVKVNVLGRTKHAKSWPRVHKLWQKLAPSAQLN